MWEFFTQKYCKKGKDKAFKKAMKFSECKPKAEKSVAEYDRTIYDREVCGAYKKVCCKLYERYEI